MMLKNYFLYFFYFIFNIIFFSFLSIYTYQLLCTNNLSYLFLNNFISIDQNSNLLFYFFNIENKNCDSSIHYQIKYNIFTIFNNNLIFFLNFKYLYIITNYILITYLLNLDLYYFLLYTNIFKIYFFTKLTYNYINNINFECLQNIIYLYPNETSLVFFRLESSFNVNLLCMTIYMIYPIKLSFLITKIQCFCFSNIILHSYELIELPVLFYIDNFFSTIDYKLYIFYLLLIV